MAVTRTLLLSSLAAVAALSLSAAQAGWQGPEAQPLFINEANPSGYNYAPSLIVEGGTGGQYCRGDRVRGLEPGAIIPGPTCNLGDWVPYRQP